MTTTDDLRIADLSAIMDLERTIDSPAGGCGPPVRSRPRAANPTINRRGVNEPECRSTRAALHDYLNRLLAPRRQLRLETHMDGCAECIRAFIDIREASWRRRAASQPGSNGTPVPPTQL